MSPELIRLVELIRAGVEHQRKESQRLDEMADEMERAADQIEDGTFDWGEAP